MSIKKSSLYQCPRGNSRNLIDLALSYSHGEQMSFSSIIIRMKGLGKNFYLLQRSFLKNRYPIFHRMLYGRLEDVKKLIRGLTLL